MKTLFIFLFLATSVGLVDAAHQITLSPNKPAVLIVQDYKTVEGGATVNVGPDAYLYTFSRNNTYQWTNGVGGSGMKVINVAHSDVTGWSTSQENHQMSSPASELPVIAAGTDFVTSDVRSYYGVEESWHSTGTSSWTPDLFLEHCDVKQKVSRSIGYPSSFVGSHFDHWSSGNYHRTADAKIVLKTGGKAKSQRQSLFCITASATNLLDKLSQALSIRRNSDMDRQR